jgi:gliding motility-associated-like protein
MKLKLLFFLISFLSISTLFAQENYYWVGGTGIWANLSNWQTSNGSIPSEVPDINDNVIFNANSFQQNHDTVWINSKNPECKNMIWENIMDSVVMAGGADSTSLLIYGSLYFDSLVSNAYKGSIHFKSGEIGETLTMNGNKFGSDIYFDGNGSWILQDTLLAWDDTTYWAACIADPNIATPPNPIIYMIKGTLNTNGQTVISKGFSSTTQSMRHLIMENSDFYLIGSWLVNASGMTLDANNSLITMRGDMLNYNSDGKSLVYNNVDKIPNKSGDAGMIESKSLRTQFNVVQFFGSGNMQGDNTIGAEGKFTIDTVLMGFGPSPNSISGPVDSINYGKSLAPITINTSDSYIHKFVFNMGGKIDGADNDMDSLFCLDVYNQSSRAKATIVGKNFIDYLYFATDGVIGSYPGSNNEVVDAVFAGDGWLNGKNTFHNLNLSSGFWYQIGIDSLDTGGNLMGVREQTILNSLEVIGGCTNGMTLLSSSKKTVQGRIKYDGPGLSTEYLSVRDITSIGTGTITIDNGIDIDNNDGIVFNEITGRDLYWVGGNGNWSDNIHWSLTDGSAIGDQCPPNIRDNVFVTDQSGLTSNDSVKINVKYACSNDQLWTLNSSAMLFGPDSNNIRIWGSLEYSEPMVSKFRGKYFFESEHDTLPDGTYDPQTIDLAGKELSSKCTFYGNNGAWILKDSLINRWDTLFFTMGYLNTNGQTLRCYNFHSMDTLDRILKLDTSIIIVHQKGADAWLLNGYNIEFYSDSSTIRSMADLYLMPGEPPNQGHIRSMNADSLAYWNIEFYALKSMLKSEGYCIYNLVDYMPDANSGEVIGGPATIDTLTFQEGAFGCVLKHSDTVNVVMAYSINDTIRGMNNHYINEANFFQDGAVTGYNWIGNLNFYELGEIFNHNDIDSCVFYDEGHIYGQNTFDTLIFKPSFKYFLQHDSIQTINNLFDVNGTCVSPIRIQSDSIGTQAKIEIQYSSPIISFASFRDLNALDINGNTPYTAEYSIDLGNNTNWDFVDQPIDSLFWIAGGGDWGDSTHWSFSSGGPPIYCLPREENTVVFDDNSFTSPSDTIYVKKPNISCKSLLWKHSDNYTPIFVDSIKTDLYVYGDLLLSDSMDYRFEGIIHFDEISGEKEGANTITCNGQKLLNDIVFQGINGEWILMDSLELEREPSDPPELGTIFLEHGKFVTNGKTVTCTSLNADYNNVRKLDMKNSDIYLIREDDNYAWVIDGDSFELEAEGSTIINVKGTNDIYTYDGDYFKYNDIVVEGDGNTLDNSNNTVEYNVIAQKGLLGEIKGNFIADTILFTGSSSSMQNTSETNVVIIEATKVSVSGTHHIKRCFVNKNNATIEVNNNIDYCICNSNCYFKGENTFDTLFLTAGEGNSFYFEESKTQLILDTLGVRGNQCYSVNLISITPNMMATIRIDSAIVSGDYLKINHVAIVGENSQFYAGLNSNPDPPGSTPSPGWFWDNDQGYIFGFGDGFDSFCEGEEYVIQSINFNGNEDTEYFWENSSLPGGKSYTVNSPGTYTLRIEYSSSCILEEKLTLTLDYPPDVNILPGPYCEGDIIDVDITPPGEYYLYEWSDGSYSSFTNAVADSTELAVNVTNTVSGCSTKSVQTVEIHETPKPDDYLADDVILHFGETIELDAGPGDSYEWETDDPSIVIPNPNERYILGYGLEDTVTYTVLVSNMVMGILEGCTAEAVIKVAMYPEPAIGVPTAFSPNGIGPDANEELKVQGGAIQEMDFRIYNRYGLLVFETNDIERGWDGKYEGKNQPEEVYTYYLKAIFVDGGIVEKKGNITLLR